MEYYVDQKAVSSGNGSKEAPFQHISQAAYVAAPGDVIYVLPGIYREWVDPQNGGTPDQRITYISKEPLKAVITGGERISEWKLYEGQVWKLCVDNSFFTYRNPYTTRAAGDWLDSSIVAHLGDVFLDGKSLYEVDSLNSVLKPETYLPSWDPEFSVYTWYTTSTAKIQIRKMLKFPSVLRVSIRAEKELAILPCRDLLCAKLQLNGHRLLLIRKAWSGLIGARDGS